MLLLDGLYPNGPIMARCRQYHWDFMIVLKDGSLPTVWEEYHSLLLYQQENQHRQNWGERRQHFQWVNSIRYYFGTNGKNHIDINVVVCTEQWEEVDPKTAQIITKESKQAWISSRPISRLNVHTRCNLGARYRWGIEGAFLVEKHQGYSYEHAFAKNWNAMKGYHYLMRLSDLTNVGAGVPGGLYSDQGYTITGASLTQSVNQGVGFNNNEHYLTSNFISGLMNVTNSSGLFDVASLYLAGGSQSETPTVSILGLDGLGGTIASATYTHTGGSLANFVLAGFTGITTLKLSNTSGRFSIDNLDASVSAVPLPAAVWLFGSALAGLGFLGNRRRRQRV